MKQDIRFTIGWIDHDEEIHNKYLGPSLFKLEGNFDLISTSDELCPAKNYNFICDTSLNEWIILTHQDVTFRSDLLFKIEKTINNISPLKIGALGLVGVDNNKTYLWSNESHIYEVDTLDCCFIVINKNNKIRFNEEVFDDFHLYVEDYCANITKNLRKKCYTILTSGMGHGSATLSKLGGAWGRYNEYKEKFNKLWPGIKTT